MENFENQKKLSDILEKELYLVIRSEFSSPPENPKEFIEWRNNKMSRELVILSQI